MRRSHPVKLTKKFTIGLFCDTCRTWFPGKPGERHKCLGPLREQAKLREKR